MDSDLRVPSSQVGALLCFSFSGCQFGYFLYTCLQVFYCSVFPASGWLLSPSSAFFTFRCFVFLFSGVPLILLVGVVGEEKASSALLGPFGRSDLVDVRWINRRKRNQFTSVGTEAPQV